MYPPGTSEVEAANGEPAEGTRQREPNPVMADVGEGFRTPPGRPAQRQREPQAHPDYLVSMARNLGIPDATIAGRSTEQLGELVDVIHQREASRADAFERLLSRQQQHAQPQLQPAQPQPQPEPPYDFGVVKDSDGRDVRVDLTHLDPYVAQVIRSQQRQIEELRQQTQQSARTSQLRRAFDVLDEAFEGLSRDYGHFFGVGTGVELRESNQVNFLNRRVQTLIAAGVDPDNPPPAPVVVRKVGGYLAELRALAGDESRRQAGDQQPAPGGDFRQPPNPYSVPEERQTPPRAPAPRQPQFRPQPQGQFQPAGAFVQPPTPAQPHWQQQPRGAQTGRYLSPAEAQAQQQWGEAALAVPTRRQPIARESGRAKAIEGVGQMMREFAEQEAAAGGTGFDENGQFVP